MLSCVRICLHGKEAGCLRNQPLALVFVTVPARIARDRHGSTIATSFSAPEAVALHTA